MITGNERVKSIIDITTEEIELAKILEKNEILQKALIEIDEAIDFVKKRPKIVN